MKKYKLGELGNIITGKTPPTNDPDNYGGVIPFLTPSDDLSEVYVRYTTKTISNKGLQTVKNLLLPPDSICVSCIGSDLGKVIMTNVDTVTNQQFNSIIPSANVNPRFLYYYLTKCQNYLKRLSASSTSVPIINKSQFTDIEVLLPEIDEQAKIANYLTMLDKKIALNREINRNLPQASLPIPDRSSRAVEVHLAAS